MVTPQFVQQNSSLASGFWDSFALYFSLISLDVVVEGMMKRTILQRCIQNKSLEIARISRSDINSRAHLPFNFDVCYELGSREFTLFSSVGSTSVLVFCNVSSRRLRSVKGGQGETEFPPKRLNVKRRRQSGSADRSPVVFSAFVSMPTSGLTIEALCCSSLGLLVVDGVSFHQGPLTESMIPQDAHPGPEGHYQGPLLNQRSLAEMVVNTRGCITSVDPFRQQESFFDGHVNPWNARSLRFGHVPVHTAKPGFSDALCHFLEVFGVNDELAFFVEDFAHLVHREEETAWTNVLKTMMGGR
ncbi:hypothetical protein, conserved [Trypanosoma brucei brucei TREU927]|uniref:Uncharacterized protein n=2 Tax=Trypanozoon TaxID=39700 RepID=Q38C60_TRYB2|nr:hypothetical protein, conserved [Trypanosoma brucei brucei TREU927]EAN77610.1 hypothetical protein, conserved [Trypanosoma brucei brucei TREU927]